MQHLLEERYHNEDNLETSTLTLLRRSYLKGPGCGNGPVNMNGILLYLNKCFCNNGK